MAIAHRSSSDSDSDTIRATYDDLAASTLLSRPKISGGLKVLEDMGIILRPGQSIYELSFDAGKRWAKLPAKGLYAGAQIKAFKDFTLRSRVELDAVKTYLLLVNRKSFDRNTAEISYEGIEKYSGVPSHCISAAISLLIKLDLIKLESRSFSDDVGHAHVYRIAHMEAVRHRPPMFAPESDLVQADAPLLRRQRGF
jgi:hypothetical protein